MASPLQVVIVCGGRGTRLAGSIGEIPKVLTPMAGRPLLAHLLDDLASFGEAKIHLLAGHGGEKVRQAAQQPAPRGLRIETHVEERALGTAGALHALGDRLEERFVFACGDIITSLDWPRFHDHALDCGGLATLLVHRSSHPEDSDLVTLDDADRAVGWSRRGDRGPRLAGTGALGNAGLAVLHRDVLHYIPRDRPSDLFRDILPPLVDRRAKIHGYRTSEYVRDMGTPARLSSVSKDLESGRVSAKAELALIDRDGVINRERGLVTRAEELHLLPGAARGIRRLNRAGVRTAVVTNQSILARGLTTEKELRRIHDRLAELLAAEGAAVDRVYFCPHHPETHHGEGRPELRGPCACRKPGTGMVEQAIADLGVPAWRGVVIGDRTSDMQLAANAGLASIGVGTGQGLGDGLCPAKPVWTFADLDAASEWLCVNAADDTGEDMHGVAATAP